MQIAAQTKRQTGPAVCRIAGETGVKSGKARTRETVRGASESPANRPDSDARATRLKIVVSPVRVRVSPSQEVPANQPVFLLVRRCSRERLRATGWPQDGQSGEVVAMAISYPLWWRSPTTSLLVPRRCDVARDVMKQFHAPTGNTAVARGDPLLRGLRAVCPRPAAVRAPVHAELAAPRHAPAGTVSAPAPALRQARWSPSLASQPLARRP